MCDNLVALLRGRPPNLGIDGLPRPDFGVAEPYTIPSAPGPGVDDIPRVVLCWLPGGMMLACPVPQLAASEVRQEIARALRVRVEALREHTLLFCDLRWPGSLEVWSETTPLPDAFFCPTMLWLRATIRKESDVAAVSASTRRHGGADSDSQLRGNAFAGAAARRCSHVHRHGRGRGAILPRQRGGARGPAAWGFATSFLHREPPRLQLGRTSS